MALTIYDISKKAGVSIATVSRVLNGSESVKPATREKVMRVIEQYDYTPNAFARGMGLHSLRTVGILCPNSADHHLAKAIYYIQQELQENGYESLLCCTGYELDNRRNYCNLILSKKVDSLILVGSNYVSNNPADNDYIKAAADQVPVMLLNASYPCPNVYSTLCDDYAATYDATSSLLKKGIRDILYLYDSNSYSGTKKLSGYRAAMQDAGITNYEKLIHFYDGKTDQIPTITAFVEALANQGISFHGVVASDDALAIGALKYARKKGLAVPETLSIIGYNNSMLTSSCDPELTSVDNRLETLTHELVQTLLAVLSGQQRPSENVFTGKLIQRGTTN